VEHGCSIATIGGARGILVVGGATGDDLVEFLDWEDQMQWVTLGKLNRGRGQSPVLKLISGIDFFANFFSARIHREIMYRIKSFRQKRYEK
jgi:hypothetical protein